MSGGRRGIAGWFREIAAFVGQLFETLVVQPLRRFPAFVTWLVARETLASSDAGESAPPRPGIRFREWLLARDRLGQEPARNGRPPSFLARLLAREELGTELPVAEPGRRSFLRWLAARESLPRDPEPLAAPPAEGAPRRGRSFLGWLLARERLDHAPPGLPDPSDQR